MWVMAAMLASTSAVLDAMVVASGVTSATASARRLRSSSAWICPICPVAWRFFSYIDCRASLERPMPHRPRLPMASTSRESRPAKKATRVEMLKRFMVVGGYARIRRAGVGEERGAAAASALCCPSHCSNCWIGMGRANR